MAAKQRGASVNMRGKEGLTPLHLALLHVSFGGFTALLENGADPNIVADNGVAVMSLVPALAESKWLEAALRAGGDVEKRDDRRQTPLMLAASRGRVENVQLLLANGADVNARDERQSGALEHTFHAIKPSATIAELLIAGGAAFDRPDDAGFTARDYAKTYRDPTLMAVFDRRR
jgi:ankyrin repeat protein